MRKIADSTIRRLSLYLRFLEEFEEQGIETVSSEALAARGGTTSAQVRKDLSFFGSFGKRGLGYSVPELLRTGCARSSGSGPALSGRRDRGGEDRQRPGAVSRLPATRVRYRRHLRRGPGQDRQAMERPHGPDRGRAREGSPRPTGGHRRARHPGGRRPGRSPTAWSASVVKAILNFAPVQLAVPDDVALKTVNLALELETLSYALTNR